MGRPFSHKRNIIRPLSHSLLYHDICNIFVCELVVMLIKNGGDIYLDCVGTVYVTCGVGGPVTSGNCSTVFI